MSEQEQKYPAIIAPVNSPALTPEEFAKGKDTVTMVFEKPVLFTPSHGTKVHFPKGVCEVPRDYQDHWYLKAHNAYPYVRPVPVAEVPKGDAKVKKVKAEKEDTE